MLLVIGEGVVDVCFFAGAHTAVYLVNDVLVDHFEQNHADARVQDLFGYGTVGTIRVLTTVLVEFWVEEGCCVVFVQVYTINQFSEFVYIYEGRL